jgi:hypothetical protein
MREILTKPVAEMTTEEALLAARAGRLQYLPEENTPESGRNYESLPDKSAILKQIELEQSNIDM